jgi:hypothetical protein
VERREGEQGEVRCRLGGASPFYRGVEASGLQGQRQCLDLMASVTGVKRGGGVIVVH